MTEYRSNIDLDAAVTRLLGAKRVIITTHGKPDGDAFGSVVALAAALRHAGIGASGLLIPPVPANFASMQGAELTCQLRPDDPLPEADLYVIVDTGAWAQVHSLRPNLEPRLDRTLIIDHHISGDIPAAEMYIDSAAAACCEIIAQIVDRVDAQAHREKVTRHDPVINDALFIGLASDTGWFRFSNTRPRTHQLAASLIERGVDQAALYAHLEQTERVEKLRLMIRALDSLELVAHDQAAIMVIRARDFAETGAMLEETERFVDIPQAVATVQMVALITEPPPENGSGDAIRISFRSKPSPDAVNVAELAQQFGGGGHARAAGAKLEGTLDSAVARVQAAIRSRLEPRT